MFYQLKMIGFFSLWVLIVSCGSENLTESQTNFNLVAPKVTTTTLHQRQMEYLDLVTYHAPNFYHATDPKKPSDWDFLRKVNYDGDLFFGNQTKERANQKSFSWDAHIYWYVQETESHYFINYQYFHPIDDKKITNHPNDIEGVSLMIKKDGSLFGGVEAASTMAHWYFRHHTWKINKKQFKWKWLNRTKASLRFDSNQRLSFYIEKIGHGAQGPNFLKFNSDTGTFEFKKKEAGYVYSLIGNEMRMGTRLQTYEDTRNAKKAIYETRKVEFSYSLVSFLDPQEGLLSNLNDCIRDVLKAKACQKMFNGNFIFKNENKNLPPLGQWGPFPGKFGKVDFPWTYKGGEWGVDPATHWRNQLKSKFRDQISLHYIENPVSEILSSSIK